MKTASHRPSVSEVEGFWKDKYITQSILTEILVSLSCIVLSSPLQAVNTVFDPISYSLKQKLDMIYVYSCSIYLLLLGLCLCSGVVSKDNSYMKGTFIYV